MAKTFATLAAVEKIEKQQFNTRITRSDTHGYIRYMDIGGDDESRLRCPRLKRTYRWK